MRQKAEAEAAKVRRVVAFKAELDEDRILAVISRNENVESVLQRYVQKNRSDELSYRQWEQQLKTLGFNERGVSFNEVGVVTLRLDRRRGICLVFKVGPAVSLGPRLNGD